MGPQQLARGLFDSILCTFKVKHYTTTIKREKLLIRKKCIFVVLMPNLKGTNRLGNLCPSPQGSLVPPQITFQEEYTKVLFNRKWKSFQDRIVKMRNVVFTSTDFELFDPDITPQDYEFFQKHKGAFKGLLEDQVLT